MAYSRNAIWAHLLSRNREGVERAKELIVEAVEEGKHRSNGASLDVGDSLDTGVF